MRKRSIYKSLIKHIIHVCMFIFSCKKVETLQKQISTATTEVKTFNIELVELKRRLQEYEITRQSLVTTVQQWNKMAEMIKSVGSTNRNKFECV